MVRMRNFNPVFEETFSDSCYGLRLFMGAYGAVKKGGTSSRDMHECGYRF